MIELKPCPFCGGEAKCAEMIADAVVFCAGKVCLVRPKTPIFTTPELAAEAWNTRPEATND